MALAIEEARKCSSEDSRVHPKVGAVVVTASGLIVSGYRGECAPGEHAEYTVLERKMKDIPVAGATVYTTLEPCTTRSHPKIPCADRLIERRIARVLIGMLDPNPEIRGLGQLRLRDAKVATEFFDSDLMEQIEEANREFIRAKRNQSRSSAVSSTTERYDDRGLAAHRFDSLIEEKTEGFVGRQYIFDAVESFLEMETSGYLTIVGDPGEGKTALLAKYVQNHQSIAFFNLQSEGLNRPSQFITSVCQQLAARFRLPYEVTPSAVSDSALLRILLSEAAKSLSSGERLVVAVDAVDEASRSELSTGANVMYLPASLPKRVYFVLTSRREPINLVADTPIRMVDLIEYSGQSAIDIQEYVRRAATRESILNWILIRNLEIENFVARLTDNSQNNFMYVKCVLQGISSKVYEESRLDELPIGLEGYYRDHWRRMGMIGKPQPRERLKLIYVLATVQRPISRRTLSRLAGVDELFVQGTLDEWQQFLHATREGEETLYGIYHSSFRDFLHRKDVVEAAGFTIRQLNELVAKELWESLFAE